MSATIQHTATPKSSRKKIPSYSCKRKKTLLLSKQLGSIRKIRHTDMIFEQTPKPCKYINQDTMNSLTSQKFSSQSKDKAMQEQQGKGIFQKQSLKQKYSYLLPQYLRIKYDENHQILVEIVIEIENILSSLSAVKKVSLVGLDQIQQIFKAKGKIINASHLRQIYYLISNFYQFSLDQNRKIIIKYDGFNNNSIWRISLFKSTLYQYLKKNHAIIEQKSTQLTIPQKSFQWETKTQHPSTTQQVTTPISKVVKKKTQKDLQQRLLQEITIKQQMYKQLNQQASIPQKFTVKMLKDLLSQIHRYFTIKNVSNIFEVTLIEVLKANEGKSNKYSIKKGINQLWKLMRQKNIQYLKYKQLNGRTIIQIDRSKYQQALYEVCS